MEPARDSAAWSIPKGEYGPDETPLQAARREFTEELGLPVPDGELIELGTVTQSGGKQVTAWAAEADLDLDQVVLGTFELEWPRGSGRIQRFPELDRVAWCTPEQAAGAADRQPAAVPGPVGRAPAQAAPGC